MGYTRVIPRDLFNEANLLKCMGGLYIALEHVEGRASLWPESVPKFDIDQNVDGATYVRNLFLVVDGNKYSLIRPLNSRSPWPLYVETDEDQIEVFNDNGTLSPDFIAFISKSGDEDDDLKRIQRLSGLSPDSEE